MAALVGAALVIAGCGASPQPKTIASTDSVEVDENGQVLREVPPEAQTMFEQAASVMATGDYLEAQLRFQEFLLQYPQFPGAHVNLAIIYRNTGDLLAAENSLTDALMLDPEHSAALNQLGMLLRKQGKFADAEAAYTRLLSANPNYAMAHYNLGVLNELYLQDLNKALHHFESYQTLNGDDKQVEKWIADLKRRIGAAQRAANVTE